ncbi:unnamed protein product [Rotaria sordida]|uniref:Uncharacterized protein n=1 Tax=Rotaria sordida TaxID=392033 RepID=A0A819WIT8_9BILA|nr:unnamed protein product [Rotaria sordida]
MLTTTTISPVDAPVTVTVNNTSYPSYLRHALIIGLNPTNKLGLNKYLPSFLDHLRSIAIQPFDMLQFRGGTPSLAIWEALQGLKNISHLEMLSGYDEYCNIEPLDQVSSSWPLQSIVIGSACGEDIKTAHIHTITSLTLDYCCGLSFSLATRNGTNKLQRLIIIENDACDHFIKLQEETCLTKNLTELKIVSTNGCDFCHQYERECFGKALIQCHSLKSLDLTLHDSSENSPDEHYLIELPLYFPPNVESLRFRGSSILANHLTVWHKCVSDPNWLPNLKFIKFCLHVRHDDNETELEKTDFTNDQSMQLLKDLILHRPSVTILNNEV